MPAPVTMPVGALHSKLEAAIENAAQACRAWSEPPPRPAGEARSEDEWLSHCERQLAKYDARYRAFQELGRATRPVVGQPGVTAEVPSELWQLLRATMQVELPEPPPPADEPPMVSTLSRPDNLDKGERTGEGEEGPPPSDGCLLYTSPSPRD